MGDAAAKASARALVSTQMANMAAQQRANIIAQYGPVSKMAIFTCKHIGRAFPHRGPSN